MFLGIERGELFAALFSSLVDYVQLVEDGSRLLRVDGTLGGYVSALHRRQDTLRRRLVHARDGQTILSDSSRRYHGADNLRSLRGSCC